MIEFRKIVLVAFILLGGSLFAQQINWMTFEEAMAAQKNEPRKIMVDAYTTWCGPCKLLDKKTFQNKDVSDFVNKNYYAVKFNAEGNKPVNFQGKTFQNPSFDPAKSGRNSPHELTGFLGVRAYPTILFIDEESNLIAPLTGYRTPRQLEIYLKLFGSNDYKSITTKELWEDYSAKFKYEFIE